MSVKTKKIIILLFALYALSISAILRANFNYIDDMGRAFSGYKGWSFYSRFTSDFLSRFIHCSDYLADISPLTQLLAALIMAVSGAIVIHILAPDGSLFWSCTAMVPFALSPYFLQCFSYKYDSPYMALSVLFSVAPLLIYGKEKKKQLAYFFSVLAGTLLVCTSYQAASGIFPMLCIALALKMWNENEELKKIAEFILISVAGYLFAMVIFRLFIVVPVDFYASTDIVSLNGIIPALWSNIKTYFTVIIKDFRKIWLILIAIIAVLFVAANAVVSKRGKLASALIALAALAAMAIISYGAYLVLAKPLFDPRGMYGFGVFISVISTAAVASENKIIKIGRIAAAALAWTFIVFSFEYGNALSYQKEYTEFRIDQVVSSINALELEGEEINVQLEGDTGLAPAIENIPADGRMLTNLIPIYFGEDESWGYAAFLQYRGLERFYHDSSVDLRELDLPLLADTELHTIRGDENNLLIILK